MDLWENYSLFRFGRRFPRRGLRGPSPSLPSAFSPLGPGLFTFGKTFASSAFTRSYFLSFARFVHSYGSFVSSYSSSPRDSDIRAWSAQDDPISPPDRRAAF